MIHYYKKKQKSKKPLIFSWLLIIIIISALFFFLRKKDNDKTIIIKNEATINRQNTIIFPKDIKKLKNQPPKLQIIPLDEVMNANN